MQILNLTLTNWGPFYGDHHIDLEVDETAPVILFRGENMRGKTSLLRAIVWCLYGDLREQDGHTRLRIARMVNTDAVESGDITFGVSMRFSHSGDEYILHRSAHATLDHSGGIAVSHLGTDLKPNNGNPYPAAMISEKIDSILSQDISNFFFFDGEMLNRFYERLRDERSVSEGFVRQQVEKALGLPFMQTLESDFSSIQALVTASMNQALKKAKKHEDLTDKYNQKTEEFESKDCDLMKLRAQDEALAAQIAEKDAELSRVDQIKDLFYERKSLEGELGRGEDAIRDMKDTLARYADSRWWLPAADELLTRLADAERQIDAATRADKQRYELDFQIGHIREQLASGVCPMCKQTVATQDDTRLHDEIADLQGRLARVPAINLEQARREREQLRQFSGGREALERVYELEQDIGREKLRNDKRRQRIREISEGIGGNAIDIESLERTLIDLKAKRQRIEPVLNGLSKQRDQLRNEIATLSKLIADQPEVDATERKLGQAVAEAVSTVKRAYDGFSDSMRRQVEEATSELFRRLTTEKEYIGVRISDGYQLSVVDDRDRSLNMISAGANQILTMAFIGALAQCAVEEAPMVMDTPFGRLDTGHRAGILEWVSGFESQVVLFVQSGEYDPIRDAKLLGGKIGREYTINRLGPNRSEVRSA